MSGNQGMSSEELDKLTTEEEAPPVEEETPPAEELDEETPTEESEPETPPEEPDEALDETEEKPEVDPKDAVIGGMRRKLRAAELKAARVQGELAAQQARPQEKSPMELAAEAQEVSIDEVEMNGKLYKEQRAWEQRQAETQATQKATADYKSGSEAAFLTMTDETLGEGLGLEALARVGEHLLTDQDRQEVFAAGKKCGIVLYKRLKERIIEAGGADAERLKPTQAKPKEKGPKTPKTPEKKPGPKPQDERDESEVRASTKVIMDDLEMF